jgi:hypothetical protein
MYTTECACKKSPRGCDIFCGFDIFAFNTSQYYCTHCISTVFLRVVQMKPVFLDCAGRRSRGHQSCTHGHWDRLPTDPQMELTHHWGLEVFIWPESTAIHHFLEGGPNAWSYMVTGMGCMGHDRSWKCLDCSASLIAQMSWRWALLCNMTCSWASWLFSLDVSKKVLEGSTVVLWLLVMSWSLNASISGPLIWFRWRDQGQKVAVVLVAGQGVLCRGDSLAAVSM